MKKIIKVSSVFGLIALSFAVVAAVAGPKATKVNATWTPTNTYTNGDAATYYNGISSTATGSTLLSELKTLNLSRRKSTVGYSAMGTSASNSAYIYTDYDPNSTISYDSNGQKYGSSILSFYSGKSSTSWNREHVWPNSRGGGSRGTAGAPYPDADIFMPRPTISSENSDRGNSVYVEGMAHSSNGWDPVTAFESSLGVYNNIRGECARIIFYCMTVNSNLVLNESTSNAGNNMGKLTDLLDWSIRYPVNEREKNRNEGGEYLQGNRNAFVDHPEYACKIWGETSDETRAICAKEKTVSSLTLNYTSETLPFGQSLNLSVTANYTDETTGDVTQSATYSSSNESVATVSTEGVITSLSSSSSETCTITVSYGGKTATCQITGGEPTYVDLTGVTANSVTTKVGKTATIQPIVSPSNVFPYPEFTFSSNNISIATVSNTGVVTGVAQGTTTINLTATQGDIVKNTTVSVTIEPQSNGWELAESLSVGDEVIFGCPSVSAVGGATNTSVLNSVTDGVVYNSDEKTYTTIPDETQIFTVGKNGSNYTLKSNSSNNLLGCTAAKKINTSGEGVTTWNVNFSTDAATLSSTTSSYGTMQYNTEFPRFTTYASAQTAVNLYKNSSSSGDSVSLDKTNDSVLINGQTTLVATASGAVTWSSNNESVATVSDNGVVTGHSVGTATITATCGTASASCLIEVKSNSLTIDPTSLSLTVGKTATITATSTSTVTWSSNNSSVASVDSNGLVTANSVGSATITASSNGETATCSVLVTAAPTSNDGLTPETAFSVSEATNHIQDDDLTDSTTYYVVGKYVSTSYSWKSGTMTIIVCDINNSEKQFKFYKMACSSDPGFTTNSIVTAYALGSKFTLYNTEYELNTCTYYGKTEDEAYKADNFAQDLLDGITCDATGQTEPVYSTSWDALETKYKSLSSAQQNLLITATYTISGTGPDTVVTETGSTTNVVARAMYRYDYIVAKYDKKAFIEGRDIQVSFDKKYLADNNELITPMVIIITVITASTILGYICIRKKHN